MPRSKSRVMVAVASLWFAAVGFRLGVPAGTAVRFEPGASREVTLVRLAGTGTVPGLQIHDGGSSSAPAPGTES